MFCYSFTRISYFLAWLIKSRVERGKKSLVICVQSQRREEEGNWQDKTTRQQIKEVRQKKIGEKERKKVIKSYPDWACNARRFAVVIYSALASLSLSVISTLVLYLRQMLDLFDSTLMVEPENTKRGSITVPLTSCLTGLNSSVLQIKTKIVSCHTANSKPVKQEVNGTVILPL
jgi:hypothetical protein